jgi:hypothetical protein
MRNWLRKIFTPYKVIKEQQHLIENYRFQYEKLIDMVREEQKRAFQLKETVEHLNQRSSELQDEIDIQRAKAAKYLSFYLQEMEKHAPND